MGELDGIAKDMIVIVANVAFVLVCLGLGYAASVIDTKKTVLQGRARYRKLKSERSHGRDNLA